MPKKDGSSENWLQQLLEHEETVKRKDTKLFRLYMKARDKRRAAKIIADAMRRKITYQEALRELKKLAEAQ